jgi:hypothetical protein
MLRVISIAAVLGALVTLAAEHRTQAQNVLGVSRLFADTFAPNPSTKSAADQRDFGYVEGNISARTALAKSVRRVGRAAEDAKCPQKNSQNFTLRFSTGFEPL